MLEIGGDCAVPGDVRFDKGPPLVLGQKVFLVGVELEVCQIAGRIAQAAVLPVN